MNVWALHICPYSFLGKETLILSELLKGAEFTSDFPNFEVTIPHIASPSR